MHRRSDLHTKQQKRKRAEGDGIGVTCLSGPQLKESLKALEL
jgi:hypothetical protein